ncbi:hypothetical protein CBS101457_001354 [Exobasidium rhododendri]|nr:hypothetical protein CBS101457_001354 [Exobasidium rhododendri]
MSSMTHGGKAVATSATGSSNGNRGGDFTANHVNNAATKDKEKGHNLNHLMAFTLPPRLAPPASNGPARRTRRGGGTSVPFNKERYVNAQYRFLVKPTGDYTVYFADSDIYLNWSDILTVLIPTTSALSTASHTSALSLSLQPSLELHEGAACPICLSPPTAPRMTKCGHVFCYPCILHYLNIQDADASSGTSTPTAYNHHVRALATTNTVNSATPKWKRCPICWDAVYAKDLKAVQWWDAKGRAQEFEREEEARTSVPTQHRDKFLCMRLIERPHLTALALPQSSTWPNASTSSLDQPLIAQHSAPWHFQPDVMTFCKFMLATPDQLVNNLSSNLAELEEEKRLLQSFGMKDEMGLHFIDVAERKVQEQMEKVMNELETSGVQSRIGYAKNELKEHAEIEQGIKERNEDAMSKREKKRRERERKSETFTEGKGEGREDAGGADYFLQMQAQKQGGIVSENHAVVEEEVVESDTPSHTDRKESKSTGTRMRKNLNPPAPSTSSYFFFQASSGQNIFLHPLDIKVLLSIYGSYSAFPRVLHVCVQGADEGSMNDEIKKKCKYLTHLTKGTDIVFVEVDWDVMKRSVEDDQQGGIKMNEDVIKLYDQALKQRKNRRRDRERREDRAKLKWEETEKASRPIGISNRGNVQSSADENRSHSFSAGEDLFPSSFGSAHAASPSFREAALVGAEQQFPIHPGAVSSEDEFPVTVAERNVTPHQRSKKTNTPNHRSTPTASSGSKKTVWGTPAAQDRSFVNALHSSSRLDDGSLEDHRPDWDAWLELEEDFIVGARSGTSVREGRGLNKQIKKGTLGESASEGGGAGAALQQEEAQPRQVPGAAPTTGSSKPKKKKLVLTSGGGMRGR